jgi:hypothetical protein
MRKDASQEVSMEDKRTHMKFYEGIEEWNGYVASSSWIGHEDKKNMYEVS